MPELVTTLTARVLIGQRRYNGGPGVMTRHRAARLLRLILVGAVIAVIVVSSATADGAPCTHGVSSVGPVVLRDGHLSGDTRPNSEACLH